jgi:hypothetical protein
MCWRQLTVKTYTKALHERSVYDLNTAVADRILNRVFIRAAAFKRGFRLALTPLSRCVMGTRKVLSSSRCLPGNQITAVITYTTMGINRLIKIMMSRSVWEPVSLAQPPLPASYLMSFYIRLSGR